MTRMVDLIDRQTAKKKLRDNMTYMLAFGVDRCITLLDEVPSADVQPRKTAEWVYGEKDGADGWYCSECKFHIPWYYDYYGLKNIDFIRDFHTCPHCDAKMLKYTGMEREQND